ncbi:hypothetical protein BDD12DRAFT_915133 [Trichophaea hybrida]|nr:hypothetical protein BDD12DRAFT_915133 [Trichophaea hybrida]
MQMNLALYLHLLGDYLNALLVFLPLGVIGRAVGWDANAVFALNSLALFPLPGLLSFTRERPYNKGLLDMISVNLIPLIIGIMSITRGEIRIAQSFVIGSILLNTLLGLGGSFFLGGLRCHEQLFNSTIIGMMAFLSAVTASLFVIFGVLSDSLLPPSDDHPQEILMLSHVTAYILLLFYFLWLMFRFKTHSDLAAEVREEDDERDRAFPGTSRSVILLSARYLMASVDGVVQSGHINRSFIGHFLLPISTYTFNHIQALTNSYKTKIDKAIKLTLGASVDVTFVTLPVLILIGRAIHQPMSMQFQLLETTLLGVSVFLTVWMVSDGRSNYLKGLVLLGTYVIVILTYAVYPDITQGP